MVKLVDATEGSVILWRGTVWLLLRKHCYPDGRLESAALCPLREEVRIDHHGADEVEIITPPWPLLRVVL